MYYAVKVPSENSQYVPPILLKKNSWLLDNPDFINNRIMHVDDN